MIRKYQISYKKEKMLENACPLVTIIVPAYNVEKYIAECLESLINQTKQNHKVIIINDGSTDETENICLSYQKKHPDIISYIYQENKGVGEARNTGLKVVDTPFLTFLDGDDWLNTKFVDSFLHLIDEVDELPDMVFTLPWVYDSVTKRVTPWKDKERYDRIFAVHDGKSRVQTNSRLCPELYALEVSSCRKIYKTSFLKENNFTFPAGLKWEDVPGHFYLLHQANNCMALPEVGFFYRINQGGQITSGSGVSRLDLIPIFKQLLDIQEKYNFNDIEKTYILKLIVDFSMWSVEATNMQYVQELLKGLHEIFADFPSKDVEFYLNSYSPDKEKEERFISCITGKEYLELGDYEKRAKILDSRQEVKKKSVIRGGIQCLYEHGISYTLIWMIRKYILREQ